MKKMYNCAAQTSFDRFVNAVVNGRMEGEAPLAWERCRDKQKPILPRIPLISTVKPLPNYWGFSFAPQLTR